MNRAVFLRRAGALILLPAAGGFTRYLPVAAERGSSTLTIDCAAANYFKASDVIYDEISGERLLVTAVSGKTLTLSKPAIPMYA